MQKLLIIFISINFINNIQIKGHYHNNNGKLNHHFVFFYGQKKYGFYIFSAAINFYYDKNIFLSTNIDTKGFMCTEITLCSIGFNHQIFDDTFKKLITVYKSQAPFYLTPNDISQPIHEYLLLEFEYVNQNQNLDNNTIGLNKDSIFLNYIQKLYFLNQYYIIFSIDSFSLNRQQIMNQPNELNLQINMQNGIQNYVLINKSDSLKFRNLSINFIGYITVIKEAKIDLNLPLIALLPPNIYNKIIGLIRNIICRNPLKCITQKDLYQNYENQELNFYFPKMNSETKIKYISFQVSEIIYFDTEGIIKYHLEESNKYFDEICFGLFIFKKVDIAMQYNYKSQGFNIYFVNNEAYSFYHIKLIIFFALILSSSLTYFFQRNLTPFKDTNFKSTFSIMSREVVDNQLILNYSVIIMLKQFLFIFFVTQNFYCESKDFINSTQSLVDDNQYSLLSGGQNNNSDDDQKKNYDKEAREVSYQLNLVPDDYPYFEAGHRIDQEHYPRYLNNKKIKNILFKNEKDIQGKSYQSKMNIQKQKIFKNWKDMLSNKLII